MSSAAPHEEEGYPLAPVHTGGADDLPQPAISGGRRHRTLSGRLRAKFYSFRPRSRFVIVAFCVVVPIYLAGRFLFPEATDWDLPKPPHWGDWGGDDGDEHWTMPMKPPPPPAPPKGDGEYEPHAEEVKQAFLHAYRGYEKYAYPADELLPLSKGKIDK